MLGGGAYKAGQQQLQSAPHISQWQDGLTQSNSYASLCATLCTLRFHTLGLKKSGDIFFSHCIATPPIVCVPFGYNFFFKWEDDP